MGKVGVGRGRGGFGRKGTGGGGRGRGVGDVGVVSWWWHRETEEWLQSLVGARRKGRIFIGWIGGGSVWFGASCAHSNWPN